MVLDNPVIQTLAIQTPVMDIVSPQNNSHVLRNPETPDQSSSIGLRVVVEPPVEQILWLVDNEPYQLVDYPYSTRLPLKQGKHTIQAQVPLTPQRSKAVILYVE